MSILINSSLAFEFPYQLMFVCEERLESLVKDNKGLYSDWVVTLNLCHSNDKSAISLVGPEINKRDKTLLLTVFVGQMQNSDSKSMSLNFISSMFDCLPLVFKLIDVAYPGDSTIAEVKETLLNDISLNYERYIEKYSQEIDFDEIDLE